MLYGQMFCIFIEPILFKIKRFGHFSSSGSSKFNQKLPEAINES
jgi:hypothetical protein